MTEGEISGLVDLAYKLVEGEDAESRQNGKALITLLGQRSSLIHACIQVKRVSKSRRTFEILKSALDECQVQEED